MSYYHTMTRKEFADLPEGLKHDYKSLVRLARGRFQRACMAKRVIPVRTLHCVDCKALPYPRTVQATCYDHRDYFEPFNVEPVCTWHNIERGYAITTINKLKLFGVYFY